MTLTDGHRKSLSGAIEGNNDVKDFISRRIPSASAVKLFTEHVAIVNPVLEERVEGWTISYSFDPDKHKGMRSRAGWTSTYAPVVGVIHALDELSAAEKAGIQKALELLEMYPADLAEIANKILLSESISVPKPSVSDLVTGATLCIQLNYAFKDGGAAGCTANVCPPA